jgi:uncharacterized protein
MFCYFAHENYTPVARLNMGISMDINSMNKLNIQELYPQKFPDAKFNRQSLLPVEFFRTFKGYYLFDVNYVSFLEVNELVFKIFSILTDTPSDYHELVEKLPEFSAQDIHDALVEIDEIQSQGYLKMGNFQRHIRYTLPEIKKTLTSNLSNLYLNITSKCNLSCSYCIFGGNYEHHSNLQQQEMTWEVARKAMDFFLARARKKNHLRLDFFGGEPLLAFPLMKRIVDRLKDKTHRRNQELIISISSNGTIMNNKIADFLIKNDVYFQISLDGTKEVHDARRKFKGSHKGSFDKIIKSLQMIYDRNPNYYKKRLSLKAVLSTEFLDKDETDFFNMPLIKTIFDMNEFSVLNLSPHFDLKKDEDFFTRIHKLGKDLLQKKGVSSRKELIEGLSYKKRFLFYLTFIEFFNIQLTNSIFYEQNQPVPYMKDCLLGYEGCVNADGSISICYKSDTFIIGNVLENTWYFDRIEEFQKARFMKPECKHCFIQRFCDFCYDKINGKDKQLNSSINNYCKFKRYYYRIIFKYMLQIMENNPSLWDELEEDAEKEYSKRKLEQDKAKEIRIN